VRRSVVAPVEVIIVPIHSNKKEIPPTISTITSNQSTFAYSPNKYVITILCQALQLSRIRKMSLVLSRAKLFT
jgi:hypothetical protein